MSDQQQGQVLSSVMSDSVMISRSNSVCWVIWLKVICLVGWVLFFGDSQEQCGDDAGNSDKAEKLKSRLECFEVHLIEASRYCRSREKARNSLIYFKTLFPYLGTLYARPETTLFCDLITLLILRYEAFLFFGCVTIANHCRIYVSY